MSFDFKKWNKIAGWSIFAIATLVYLMTIEDTASLWDCGEYITAAYKLEVGHPPGAPFFMILGRLFSFFAGPENVAICINALSALSSSFTILFMFWSLSLLIRKIISIKKSSLEQSDYVAVLIASGIGSLAYTFSDSFWFSAVEGEVYAMASLFTALIFWSILKWDEEMGLIQKGDTLASSPNRWLLLIMFLLGLAIGVHLLGILVVPAIGYVIYFRTQKEVNIKGLVLTGVISILTLGFIQKGVIPGSIAMDSAFEVYFVNSLGMPFYSGSILFFALLVFICFYLISYARKNRKGILYNASMGLVFLLIGYGSFAVIVIRSNANTPLDENDPENLVTLRSYLEREQYGYTPLLSGPYWNSKENKDRSQWENANPTYIRRFVVMKDDQDIKAFTNQEEAEKYAENNQALVEEKYYVSNRTMSGDQEFFQPMRATYEDDQTTIFPRMYSDDPKHLPGYINWSGYDPEKNTSTPTGRDQKRLPTFGENLRYFFRYQVNWMYFRYFMWNFAGRQNDIQGHGDQMRGTWISGIPFIDNYRLGDQSNAPFYTTENPSNNKFFLLPLILALVGLFFHFKTAPKDAFVLTLAFIFTGLAIVVYLNQKPFEPRERDYAYAGSFYFFAMWIGIGVYALYHFLREKNWIKNGLATASLSGALCLSVPLIMAIEGWDDHDRSNKTTARDLALNYLESCGENGILFTNGDNDTFPLWYMQEVEGKRTDVRVCNLSLMGTDWYTNQMKMKAYESDPLPIKFREDQILMLAGNTDQILLYSLNDIARSIMLRDIDKNGGRLVYVPFGYESLIQDAVGMRLKNNASSAKKLFKEFNYTLERASQIFLPSRNTNLGGAQSKDDIDIFFEKGMECLRFNDSTNLSKSIMMKYVGNAYLYASRILLSQELEAKVQSRSRNYPNEAVQGALTRLGEIDQLMERFENENWTTVNLPDAMQFVYNEENILPKGVSFFPSNKFSLDVNKENALKAGIISEKQLASCPDKIEFSYNGKDYITKSEIMMLDVLANNNWERGIYWSSNRGSDLAIALLQAGYIKQIGVAYELSPIRGKRNFNTGLYSLINPEKMYHNMMEVYNFGDIKNPNVLSDYYARRHISQYRQCFLLLSQEFYAKAGQLEEELTNELSILLSQEEKDSLKALKTECLTKAIAILDRGQELMPFEHVIDFGEVGRMDPLGSLEVNGDHTHYDRERKVQALSSGHGHEYVQLYSMLGEFEKAETLAALLLEDYRSILNYFKSSDVSFAANPENAEDIHAALDACFKIELTAKETKHVALANDMKTFITEAYNNIIEPLVSKIGSLDKNRSFESRVAMMRVHYWPEESMTKEGATTPSSSELVPGKGS